MWGHDGNTQWIYYKQGSSHWIFTCSHIHFGLWSFLVFVAFPPLDRCSFSLIYSNVQSMIFLIYIHIWWLRECIILNLQMCPNYNALDWECSFEFHAYFYWPELEFSSGIKKACPFPDNEVTGPVQPIGVCCPLLKAAVLLDVSENTAYMAALQTSYFRMPTITQVFLISKPGHFDRPTLGNNYRRRCADRWGGAVVSKHRTGRRSCSAAIFTWCSCSQTALQPAAIYCFCLFVCWEVFWV